MQSAISTIREELRKVQEAQSHCVDENGIVKVWCRYRYQELVRKAKELKGSIDWMESLKQ